MFACLPNPIFAVLLVPHPPLSFSWAPPFSSYLPPLPHFPLQFLAGQRESGDDVRHSNVTAALAVANVIKTSLGPVGLDKMLVDDVGDVTITNDGATILQLLELEHPAARLLVELAHLQDKEVGDGTTSVVLLAAELLRNGNDLVVQHKIHPTTVLAGYRMALKEAVSYLKSTVALPLTSISDAHLLQAAKTSLSSKLAGGKEGDFFAQLAVTAVQSVKTVKEGNSTPRYPMSAIHVLKAHGKSTLESELLPNGFALAAARASQAMPTHLESSTTSEGGGGTGTGTGTGGTTTTTIKIALLDLNLQRHRMAMGVTIQITDPAEVERIKQKEMDLTRDKVQILLKAGAQVILTTKGLDDLVLKYFVEAGVIACRRVPLSDLRRLAKATGGQVVATLADLEGNESFDPSCLGQCGSVREIRISDGELLQFTNCQGAGASTVLLRGANSYLLDEIDRSLHDSFCVVKRLLESSALVAGGGATEAALSLHLENYAASIDTREQYAIRAFANALLIIPRQLAVNAALDASDLVAQLRAAHAKGQKTNHSGAANETTGGTDDEELSWQHYGLDLSNGTIRDNLKAGVVEPAVSKVKMLRFATEAAVTILRIDDRITVHPDPQSGGRQ